MGLRLRGWSSSAIWCDKPGLDLCHELWRCLLHIFIDDLINYHYTLVN